MSQHKGEHGACETVQIKVVPSDGNPNGIVTINHSDYDVSVHELYEPKKAKDADGDKSEGDGGKKPKKAKDADGDK